MTGGRPLLAEIVVTITVLCTLASLLATSVAGVVRTTDDGVHRVVTSARVAHLRATLAAACGRVAQPLWLPAPRVHRGVNVISIGYLDGSDNSALTILWDDESIRVEAGDESTRFGGFRVHEIAAIECGIPHLKLEVASEDGRRWILTAPFGSFPVP